MLNPEEQSLENEEIQLLSETRQRTLELQKQQIKQEQQKIIAENLKKLPAQKEYAAKREQQAFEQLLNEEDTNNKPRFGILFPFIIIFGTLLVVCAIFSIILLLIATF